MGIESLEKLGEGREAEVFAWHDGRALRLFLPGKERDLTPDRLAVEAARAARIRTPLLGEAISYDGRAGVVIERVYGGDQYQLVGRQPWRLLNEARRTGRLHARVHETAAPGALRDVAGHVRERVARAGAPADLVALAQEALAELPAGDRLLHGDFHPGNVLVEAKRRVLIDWSNVAAGPPEADVARTLVMLRVGRPPEGTPPAIRAIARFARRALIAGYLRGYRGARPLDEALLRRWLAIRAVDRFADPVEDEEPRLRALIAEAVG